MIGVIALEGDTDEEINSFIKKNNKNNDIKTKSDNIEKVIINESANEEDNANNVLFENKIDTGSKVIVDKNTKVNYEINNIKANKNIFISPLAKRIADLKNIDISKVIGTGPKGRIIKKDLEVFIETNSTFLHNESTLSEGINLKEEVKLSNIRKTIASRLQEAKSTIPHFYLRGKVEIAKLFDERIKINSFLKETDSNLKISFNDFFIKAIALSLKNVPAMNCIWNNNSLIKFSNVDLSVAVATEEGLFTPIIKSACSKSISAISLEMKDFVIRAKQGKLMPEEYTGGAFSISNLGMFDIIDFSAIINPPQSGIIALGSIIDEPLVKNNEIKIIKTVSYTLSVDHRIVDGATAAKLLKYFNILFVFKC
jgi:pyruvate dehydrogenase E2 component (dihydrolipoamide acetyltransferase)